MDTITYNLKGDNNTSDKYYEDVSIFTDEVLGVANKIAGQIIDDFIMFLEKRKVEELRPRNEYILEYLTLGVLWNTYINNALELEDAPGHMLSGLVSIRKKGGLIKNIADGFRGIFSTVFLTRAKRDKNAADTSIEYLDKLIHWISAAGEFQQEAIRLERWYHYLLTKFKRQSARVIELSAQIALWFDAKSIGALGKYTTNVERYLNENQKEHEWKEDYIFCRRRRIEYHLNMVGAEIMNRDFRDSFLKTNTRMLILPSCMKTQPEGGCRSIESSAGYACMKCNKECRVSQLTSLGENNNFKVAIIPHESDAFKNRDKKLDNTGIVGVACVLNLISGGWKAKDMGFVPQCVLLDYCGCKNHWHEKGIPTDINIGKLMKSFDIKWR